MIPHCIAVWDVSAMRNAAVGEELAASGWRGAAPNPSQAERPTGYSPRYFSAI